MSKPAVVYMFNKTITSPERMADGELVARPKHAGHCWGSTPILRGLRGGKRFSCGKRARANCLTCHSHRSMEAAARALAGEGEK